MANLTQPLKQHHKHCDDLFADAEARALAGDWAGCESASTQFLNEIEAHFQTEEQVLFPAFEAATGMSGGPVYVMRMEHAQMRDLMAQLADAVKAHNRDAVAGIAETLLIVMQQHNMKEENILYPMCDESVAPANVDVGGALRQRVEGACPP